MAKRRGRIQRSPPPSLEERIAEAAAVSTEPPTVNMLYIGHSSEPFMIPTIDGPQPARPYNTYTVSRSTYVKLRNTVCDWWFRTIK